MKYITQSELGSNLVFISGAPRSGTTWLQRELCMTSGAPFLPECTFITQQLELYFRALHYGEKRRFASYFDSFENLDAIYRENIERMIELARSLRRVGRESTFILKDPDLSLYLKELHDFFPLARIVSIVRNPLDVIASMRVVDDRRKHVWNIDATIELIYRYYYGLQMFLWQDCPVHLVVRYESVVVSGLSAISKIIDNGSVRGVGVKAEGFFVDLNDPFASSYLNGPTTQERVGSYRDLLSSEEIEKIRNVFSGVMARWGY